MLRRCYKVIHPVGEGEGRMKSYRSSAGPLRFNSSVMVSNAMEISVGTKHIM